MADAGHQVARSARQHAAVAFHHDLRRRRMIVREPVGRRHQVVDFGGGVGFVAARDLLRTLLGRQRACLNRERPLRLTRGRRLQLIRADHGLLRREGAGRQQQHRTDKRKLPHRFLQDLAGPRSRGTGAPRNPPHEPSNPRTSNRPDQTCAVWLPARCASAAFTRSGVNGTSRRRTPVASKIALPTAAATIVIAVSPAPIASESG